MRKTIFLTVSLTVMSVLKVFAQVSDLLSLEAKDQFNAGNFEACVEEMTKLIQSNPTNDEAYFERGRCQYFSADYNKIRAEKSKTITDEDKMIEATDLEFDSRRIRAIEDATKAISLNSQNAGAYNLRGLVTSKIYANGPDAEAKRAASAMADYNQAIRIDPRLVKAYINRASEFYTYSQYEEALSDLKIANSIEPENELVKTVMATVMKRIEDMKTLAEECLNSDRPYQCAETLKKYAEAHPNSAKAYLDFARVSNSVEAYSEVQSPEVFWLDAEAAYLKVLALSPKEMPAYAELYDLYLRKLGQKNKATDISVNAEKQMPQNADAVLLRGQNALLLLDPNKALAYFNKSIELDASNSEAYVGRGDAYLMLKDYAQSMSDYTRAIELDRSNGQSFFKRGELFAAQKKYEEAIIDFTAADNLKIACAKCYRGNTYTMIALANGDRPNNGNFVNARNDFSAGESDKCYLTNFLFGQSLYAQGKKDEALVQFKLAKARFNLGSEASNNQVTSVNEFIAMVEAENAAANAKLNDPNIQKILASIAETNLSKGAVLKAQGVTDFNKVAERELFLYTENGDVYFFALVSEWDPELGVGDEYYHHDKGKSIEGDHIATYEKLRIDDYSVVIYTTIIAPFAEISNLHLKPSSTGIAHWVLYRKR